MTDTLTLTLPAAWLRDATSCTLYPMAGVQVLDIISFDIVDGQPVLRHPPAELDTVQPQGAAHALPR